MASQRLTRSPIVILIAEMDLPWAGLFFDSSDLHKSSLNLLIFTENTLKKGDFWENGSIFTFPCKYVCGQRWETWLRTVQWNNRWLSAISMNTVLSLETWFCTLSIFTYDTWPVIRRKNSLYDEKTHPRYTLCICSGSIPPIRPSASTSGIAGWSGPDSWIVK